MIPESDFDQVLARVCAGDQRATRELIDAYVPMLTHVAREELAKRKLKHVVEIDDVLQSVLFHFFQEAVRGSIRVDQPAQLFRLLMVMIHHKVADHADRAHAACRDVARLSDRPIEEFLLISPWCDPSEQAAVDELYHIFLARLSLRNAALLSRRMAGESWDDIAGPLGLKAGAVRMRIARALAEIAHDLGYDTKELDVRR